MDHIIMGSVGIVQSRRGDKKEAAKEDMEEERPSRKEARTETRLPPLQFLLKLTLDIRKVHIVVISF